MTGIIILLIFDIFISLHLAIFNVYKSIIILIIRISIQWIQIIVLIIYTLKVELSFKNSYLNNKLVNDFPKEGQSLQQEQKQEKAETPV